LNSLWLLFCLAGAALLIVGSFSPALGSALFRPGKQTLARLALHPRCSLLAVGGFSLLVNVGFATVRGIPVPAVHDEFSYLLAADTFAHGRLFNPMHPLWRHFESMHIIQVPTYASKYPPAPGLALAVGQVLTSLPIAGVWLASALACAALTWMLRAWMRHYWALLAGLAACFHPLILNWSQCYWGGSVALLGGALLLGAWKRLTAETSARQSLLLASGMAILANSRPYEGAILSLLCLGLLSLAWSSQRILSFRLVSWFTLALSTVLAPCLLAMLYYNKQVTGDIWKMPYTVHAETYDSAPVFLFQRCSTPPAYDHAVLSDFHLGFEAKGFLEQQTFSGFATATVDKFHYLVAAYFGFFPFFLTLGVLAGMVGRHANSAWPPGGKEGSPSFGRRSPLAADGLLLVLFAVALLPEVWMQTHYTAPITPFCFAFFLRGLRRLHAWRPGGRAMGRFLVRWSLCLAAVIFAVQCIGASRTWGVGWQYQRAGILRELEQAGGRHLIVVRYGEGHNPHQEWVYNSADIDGSRVVWARAMEPAENDKLLGYFGDRQVWLLEPDRETSVLVPYPRTASSRPGER
jgi:hypothetical protein